MSCVQAKLFCYRWHCWMLLMLLQTQKTRYIIHDEGIWNEYYDGKCQYVIFNMHGNESYYGTRSLYLCMNQTLECLAYRSMGLFPDTRNCGLRMRRECRERFPRHRFQRKPLVNDPGMHRGTCVTHVPWCMSGSLFRGGGVNIPGIPGACATRNFTYLARGPCKMTSYDLSWLYFVLKKARIWITKNVLCSYTTFTVKQADKLRVFDKSSSVAHVCINSFYNTYLICTWIIPIG